jgi:hypothetical protein
MPRYNPLLPQVVLPSYKYVLTGEGDNNQLIVNSLYYVQATGASSIPATADLHTAFDTLLLPEFRKVQSIQSTIRKTTLYRLDAPDEIATVRGHVLPGDLAGDGLPGPVCFRITRRTLVAGQRGRGQIRVGLVAESSTVGDKVAVAFEPALDAFMTILETPIGTANPTDGMFVPYHLKRTFTLPPTVVAVVRGAPVVDWDWDVALGSQRTRLLRGLN